MHERLKRELKAAIDAVISSPSHKKIIVAGPGAGKTALFRQLLQAIGGDPESLLVLTFINNLRSDLERDLGGVCQVSTFHGYCRRLLHQNENLRVPLTGNFHYFPPLPSLIKSDWEIALEEESPQFIRLMRELNGQDEADFYLTRANYYDAVSFDDSVYRVYKRFEAQPDDVDEFDLLLVDEYQDFNKLEVEFIRYLAAASPVVIAGDDDQALYSQLRSSRVDYIRDLFRGGEYDQFQLPFCMRCTAPIVEAVADVLRHAQRIGALRNRIEKPYRFYPPRKGADSELYPTVKVVETTVQRLRGANYFGRYIQEQIEQIPREEVRESEEGHFPTVLVIGPIQYLRQIRTHLEAAGYACQVSESDDVAELDRDDGLRVLQGNPNANLGWRIMLEVDRPEFIIDVVRQSVVEERPLVDLIPDDYRNRVLADVIAVVERGDAANDDDEDEGAAPPLSIKLTSYEGSKGLSAQHVFIVGLHDGDLPRDPGNITDLEICKFLVALTRTRKQCHLVYTQRWGAERKRPSIFLRWLDRGIAERIVVDRSYWD